ncbi:hypothetical protein H0N96_02395 [Candidatus Micrarchaeota archaeon]|nr:hypothetical protein [Candidatus Micrarchaeota archaeon]
MKKIALASIILLSLGIILFGCVSQQAPNNAVNETLEASMARMENKMTSMESRLTALENSFTQKLSQLGIPTQFYYDSNCKFCANADYVDLATGLVDKLKSQGIQLEIIDVKGNMTRANALGIKRLPAFYATAGAISKSKELTDLFNELEANHFTITNAVDGLAALTNDPSEVTNDACNLKDGTVRLREFYSETCAFCIRMNYANGTAYNPATNPRYASVSNEAVEEVNKTLGSKITYEKYCIPLHTAPDNVKLIGVNKSDEELCAQKQSRQELEKASSLASDYAIASAPLFVIDCKYVFNAVTADKLKQSICAARPDVC